MNRPGWLFSGSTWYCSASSHHSAFIFCQLLGLRRGQVVHLGEVLGDVVQLPHVVVEGLAHVAAVVGEERRRVEHHRLPAVVVQRPRAEHLVVLRHVVARHAGVGAARAAKLTPSIGRLLDAADRVGRLDADEVEQRRHHVDGVDVLVARPAVAPSRAGQRTMSGSVTPPSWVSRLNRLSGVLPAQAQPHG